MIWVKIWFLGQNSILGRTLILRSKFDFEVEISFWGQNLILRSKFDFEVKSWFWGQNLILGEELMSSWNLKFELNVKIRSDAGSKLFKNKFLGSNLRNQVSIRRSNIVFYLENNNQVDICSFFFLLKIKFIVSYKRFFLSPEANINLDRFFAVSLD